MVSARSSAAIVAVAALYLNPQPSRTFVTVQQKDKGRSPASIAPVDVSADGRFVALESYAPLVPADTDRQRDIYLFDRLENRVTLESGTFPAAADASHPRLSGDARYLVFELEELAETTQQLRVDIVVLDRSSGATRVLRARAGAVPNGSSHAPEISDDGRTVVFSSVATNLVEGDDANGSLEDVYTMDLASGAVKRVSIDNVGKQPSLGFSFSPSISGDGRIIAFTSSAPFTPSGTRESVLASDARRFALRQVYVRDERAATTTPISFREGAAWPDGASVRPAISADGRFVAYSSEATHLAKDDTNRASDIFLYDRQSGTTRLVTHAPDGRPANGRSMAPAISSDGRVVAFQSDASNLVCVPGTSRSSGRKCSAHDEDVNLLWDVFVWDREEGRVFRASEDYLGGWMEPSISPAIDARGTVVAFTSPHPFDPSDQAGDFDLFVRELPDPQTTLVERRQR